MDSLREGGGTTLSELTPAHHLYCPLQRREALTKSLMCRVVMRVDTVGRLGLAVIRHGAPVEGIHSGAISALGSKVKELLRSLLKCSFENPKVCTWATRNLLCSQVAHD